MQAACRTCRFWQPEPIKPIYAHMYKEGAPSGQCRIRAPQVVTDADGGKPYTAWPETLPANWCGEHEPKPIDNTTGTEQSAEYAAYLASLNKLIFEICLTKQATTDTEGATP